MQDRIYRKIGNQSTAQCGFNKRYRMPMLQYAGYVVLYTKRSKACSNRRATALPNSNESVISI